jgi:hypothetical protein
MTAPKLSTIGVPWKSIEPSCISSDLYKGPLAAELEVESRNLGAIESRNFLQ